MLSTKNVPWQLLILLAVILLLIVGAFFIGRLVLLVYRKYKPLNIDQGDDLRLIKDEAQDSFLFTYILGWIFLAPLLAGVYLMLARTGVLERV